jgi:hypothetical protein
MEQQPFTYMTIEQRNAQRKEDEFKQECQAKAADACYLLRKQLRDQEMDRHVRSHYTFEKQEFVFVSRKEVKDEIERRCQNLLDKAKTV